MKDNQGYIILRNVRCSFPNLWKNDERNGTTFSKGVKLLLSPTEHAADIAELKAEVKNIMDAKPKIAQGVQNRPDKIALKQGDRPEYGNCLMLSCGNSGKIHVLNKDATKATEENDPIYSGCRVNAKVELWGQDNQFGKRINAKIIAIQFAGDDESFDGGHVSEEVATAGFEALEALDACDDIF